MEWWGLTLTGIGCNFDGWRSGIAAISQWRGYRFMERAPKSGDPSRRDAGV